MLEQLYNFFINGGFRLLVSLQSFFLLSKAYKSDSFWKRILLKHTSCMCAYDICFLRCLWSLKEQKNLNHWKKSKLWGWQNQHANRNFFIIWWTFKKSLFWFRIRLGSGLNWVSRSGSGFQAGKVTHKKWRNFMYLSVWCSLWSVGGFSCS